MSEFQEQATSDVGTAFVAARDQALRQIFRPNELVWLVGQRYDAVELLWDVDLLRAGAQGRWLLQRYSYDTSSGVLHFRGERPLSDDEFAAQRRAATRF